MTDFARTLMSEQRYLLRMARALCCDCGRADELTTETITKAWIKRDLFTPGLHPRR